MTFHDTVFAQSTSEDKKNDRREGKVIGWVVNEISFILNGYAIDKSLPGRLIQVIADKG
ncbi:hypothetical protein [Citrobacter amalonaticus]|uniref:hypothetical protein n=1 Tax=Citrobacter amalonaticus TaxID=35703 RepID=UPI000A5CBFA9|nr:hypothetical protein [Citrobacter amalonaticus]EKW5058599.1 hypothetical protein [Citrobacter amalonaticus]ELT8117806.1 hypothetical protein [Citrobacter amalonaticus]HAZ4786724.1 hypothetical protein [Citrobacter amalonaticus]HCB3237155.1 hypothetical protein [Citrobacter amalonaticus]HEM6699759.1 hypothetical protein [Citrobacter amalonaticus]